MLKVCICDDEISECERAKESLVAYSIAKNIELTVDVINEPDLLLETALAFDIIFLDIRFKQQDRGVETGVELRKKGYSGVIIFITTYPEYAIQGYKAEPFRYILKPYRDEDMFTLMDEVLDKLCHSEDRIIVKTSNGFVVIELKGLYYIEGAGRRRKLKMENGEVETWLAMKELFELLPKDSFAYAQKGYIVNYRHVSKVHNRNVFMRDGTQISLGRLFSRDFMLGLNRYIEKN